MEDIPLCAVCFNEYDEFSRIPKFLSCHHSFCVICIISMSNAEHKLDCPLCRKVSSNLKLSTNNELLDLAKHRKAARLNTVYLQVQESFFQHQLVNIEAQIELKKIEIAEESNKNQELVIRGSNLKPDIVNNTSRPKSNASNNQLKMKKKKKTERQRQFGQWTARSTFDTNNPITSAKGELDRLKDVISDRNAVIKIQTGKINALKQELNAAAEKIRELELTISGKR